MSDFFDEEIIDDKKKLIDCMDFLKNMSVEENVFYRKYNEINEGYKDLLQSHGATVKDKIWTPTDIYNKELTIKEIKEINPEVVFVNPSEPPSVHQGANLGITPGREKDALERSVEMSKRDELMKDWLTLRIFCHTMEYDQNPGRFLRFLIRTKVGEDLLGNTIYKYLGATSVVSDVISLAPREKYLGWSTDDRLLKGRLNNSAIGSCIMPTQPFGYNFIGGKLVACLTAGSVVRKTWKDLYGDVLVGMTTTSLYGTGSMYDGMPKYWAGIGESSGKVSIKPDSHLYELWHKKIKILYPEIYTEKMTQKTGVGGPVTGAKQRVMQMIFKEAGIKSSDYQHGYKRGVYYSLFYKNGKDFFQSKIESVKDEDLKDQWKSDSAIVEWWREKAIRRYEKLHDENRLKPDILFYDELVKDQYHLPSSYAEAKNMYFADVGR